MYYLKILLPALALWCFCPTASAQMKADSCRDIVYLKDGSIFQGKIIEYNHATEIKMKSWSGAEMKISSANVKKVVQKCKDSATNGILLMEKPYSFKERGWYHAMRFNVLPGDAGLGFGAQYSTGFMYNRLKGFGFGIGYENFNPEDWDVPTYPIFVEMRGYFLPKNISPYYAVGLGWSLSNRKPEEELADLSLEWKGGWMAQGQLGWRINNHFTMHMGLRFQHKTRTWANPWNQTESKDFILHKRLDIGVGILL